MTRIEVFPSKRGKESHPFIAWCLALILMALCVWASHWQYARGVQRHHRNAIISSHTKLAPIQLEKIATSPQSAEWRMVKTTGTFDSSDQILLRNKYADGKYGFELLTLFHTSDGKSMWVNRGWIAPGTSATSAPELPFTSSAILSVTGRLRLDNSLPQGSFFAVSRSGGNLIEKWNAQKNTRTEVYYLDLLDASDPSMSPITPVSLPELTDGPHMAYALQWLFFGGLVFYGRLLLRRGS
jgi:surfeit locus 1 family protein